MNEATKEETLQTDTEDSGFKIEEDAIENTEDSATPEPEAKPEPTPEEVEAEKETKRQTAFNKQYGEKKQFERERDALQVQVNELKQSQNQPPPELGSFPKEEDYDYDTERFESAIAQYRQDIVTNANYNASVKAQQDQLLAQQQQAQFQQAASDAETAQNVISKGKSYGIEEAQVQQNAQSLINYGISGDVFRALALDDESPLLMQHLAANSQEVANLNSMNPVQAGAYIATVLKPQAIKLKPKASNTPDPATEVQGAGIDPEDGKYKHLKGTTYS